ncbi:hypothetical protein [Nocardia callitridis]|uniref:Mce-associated membrane protein n=1 Tax=Nocardia callitridis TaxID=648753 RepID=A0ABP9KSM6_9NOCA
MTQLTSVVDKNAKSETTAASVEEPREATASHADPGARKHSVVNSALRRGRDAGDSSIKVRTVVAGVVAVAMAVTIGVLGWQLHSKTGELTGINDHAAQVAHAEQVALDYSAGAAEMNFQDLASWRGRLVHGTSPELSNRLTQAANSMEQIITPLQWVSTAQPVAAKVRSEANGVYSVDCFVSVLTKNSQAPEGIQSTATYQLSVDSRNGWNLTDIGGVGAPFGGAQPPR